MTRNPNEPMESMMERMHRQAAEYMAYHARQAYCARLAETARAQRGAQLAQRTYVLSDANYAETLAWLSDLWTATTPVRSYVRGQTCSGAERYAQFVTGA